jgi:hypothetical protein
MSIAIVICLISYPRILAFFIVSLFSILSSATACWWTCGTVDKIEVYQNEGGVTHFKGGIRWMIIPAGYVGVAFWGGAFVCLSGSRIGATIAAGVFAFALLVCLRCVLWLYCQCEVSSSQSTRL